MYITCIVQVKTETKSRACILLLPVPSTQDWPKQKICLNEQNFHRTA